MPPHDLQKIVRFFGGPMDGERRPVHPQDVNPNGEIRFASRADTIDGVDPSEQGRTQTHVYRIKGSKAVFDRSY
jgi:hypothetical protein